MTLPNSLFGCAFLEARAPHSSAMPSATGKESLVDEGGASDNALIAAISSGNEDALKSLYERYGGLVYTVALRIVGDRGLAQEVLQDVFFRCWKQAEVFDPERGQVVGWLLRIAHNRAIDLLRGGQQQARLRERELNVLDGIAADPNVSDLLDRLALRQTITSALAALPLAQRRTIEMAFYGGLTQVEIADLTGTPLGTVKTRVRDGMLRLRALLQPLRDMSEEATHRHD